MNHIGRFLRSRIVPAGVLPVCPADDAGRLTTRRAIAAVSWVVALGFAACTLTADDFEPEQLIQPSTPSARDNDAGAIATAGSAGSSSATGGTGGTNVEGQICTAGPCVIDACDGGCGPTCGELPTCSVDADCASLDCTDGCCVPASCQDRVTDLDESDVDCGGSCSARCLAGQRCASERDCADGLLCSAESGRCAPPPCEDGVRNGAEILTDCGGGACAGCPDGTTCSLARDCASNNCDASGHCTPPSCNDGVQNQDETSIDCGGGCEQLCSAGQACRVASDCQTQLCAATACGPGIDRCCQVVNCGDQLRNGDETDVDCGGAQAACARCAEGRACSVDGDCASGACQDGRCCGGTAGDCTRCAERLSATQNCSGAAQGGVADCSEFLECLRTNANVCTTRFAPGCSNDPGGVCNHNTYGGDGGLGLQQVTRVLGEAGCVQ